MTSQILLVAVSLTLLSCGDNEPDKPLDWSWVNTDFDGWKCPANTVLFGYQSSKTGKWTSAPVCLQYTKATRVGQ
jgi:hypothetical protein